MAVNISKPLYADRETLIACMDKTTPYTEVGYDRRKFMFPLKANNFDFADSKDYRQLQMADLIASATAYLNARRAGSSIDEFAKELEQVAQIDRFVINGVWPSTDMTPEALEAEKIGGINPVDFISDRL